MRYRLVIVLIFFLYACGSEELEDTSVTDSTTLSTEAPLLEIHQEYRYLIREIKTGKEFELSQEEYINSNYLGNPAYEVIELPMAQ